MAIANTGSGYPGESVGVTSTSDSITIPAATDAIYVGVEGDTTTDLFSSATIGGVAMTLVDKTKADRWAYLLRLSNPGTGVKTLAINFSSSSVIGRVWSSYSGTNTTTLQDISTKGTTSAAAITLTLTTTVNNDWLIAFVHGANPTAGSNTVVRITGSGFGIIDSNAAKTPAGSYSLAVSNSANWAGIMEAFQPAGTSTTLSKLSLLGVG